MQQSKEARYLELLAELRELKKELHASQRRSTDYFPFAQTDDAINALLSRLEQSVDTLVKSVLDRLEKWRRSHH